MRPSLPSSLSSILLDISLLLLPTELDVFKSHFTRQICLALVADFDDAVGAFVDAMGCDESVLAVLSWLREFLWPGQTGEVIKEEGKGSSANPIQGKIWPHLRLEHAVNFLLLSKHLL